MNWTILELDDEIQLALLSANSAAFMPSPGTVLFDESQRLPQIWDQVRRAVDDGAPPGRFLLTGSATATATTHSGAGRIVTLRMRPMSLAERGITAPTVSLRTLLKGDREEVVGTTDVGLETYVEEIVQSGFPGIRTLSARAAHAQLDGYISRVVEHDFPDQGHLVRRPASLLGWLRAYAGRSWHNCVIQLDPGRRDSGRLRQTSEDHNDRVPRCLDTAVAARSAARVGADGKRLDQACSGLLRHRSTTLRIRRLRRGC